MQPHRHTQTDSANCCVVRGSHFEEHGHSRLQRTAAAVVKHIVRHTSYAALAASIAQLCTLEMPDTHSTWSISMSVSPWMKRSSRGHARFVSAKKRSELVHSVRTRSSALNRCRRFVVFSPATAQCDTNTMVHLDGFICLLQIQSSLSPQDWPSLSEVCENAVAHALPYALSSSHHSRGPLMDAANRIVYLRISEREASAAITQCVVELEHAHAVAAFARRRACAIMVRTVDANLEGIKAKLWRPCGRLMAKRFDAFASQTTPSTTL